MTEARALSSREINFIARMLEGEHEHLADGLNRALVTPMNDGGMGSLRFTAPEPKRHFGRQIAEQNFADSDGVGVSAAVFVDQLGDLFELDVFKGDFSPLLALPEI